MKLSLHLAPAAAMMARLHADSFDKAWGKSDFEALLASPGAFSLMARTNDEPIGFVLARAIADEAEILTLTVNPAFRRKGVGRKLVEATAEKAAALGAAALFLEVAADNAPALALYRSCGFREVGRRDGYYAHGSQSLDALALRRDLNRPSTGLYARPGSD